MLAVPAVAPRPVSLLQRARATAKMVESAEDAGSSGSTTLGNHPLRAMLEEARATGDSKRILLREMGSASRAEIEFNLQLNERERGAARAPRAHAGAHG
jgi:hypothetical protein